MASIILLAVAIGVQISKSRATPTATGTEAFYKECIQMEVPLSINATNYFYDLPRVDSNIDAVDFVWNITTWSHGDVSTHITGVNPINTTLTINAKLCVPPHGEKSDILQIATHGIGFDQRWAVS